MPKQPRSISKIENLFHKLPPGPNPPELIYCVVEIPKGSTNKYEYDVEKGTFFLDRVLYEAMFYPTEYGIIPQAWNSEDRDPLDVMLVATFPTFPGCIIAARPIGAIRLVDSGNEDDKIIAVPEKDPRFSHVRELEDLGAHFKREIRDFWRHYADLEPGKKIRIKGWSGREKSYEIIKAAIENYQKTSK